MARMPIECPVCGSTYQLGSVTSERVNKVTISCFVCNQTIFAYEGTLTFYPFLIQRKENHLKFSVDEPEEPPLYNTLKNPD
jgi:hypothetical protein